MEQKVLEVLRGFQFEEGEEVDKKDGSVSVVQKIVGDHIAAIREAFPDKKQNGLAMKFAAYRLNIAKTEGPEHALQLKSDFNEAELIGANRPFLFEGLPGVKTVSVFLNTDEKAVAVADSEKARTDATPSKPSIQFTK